jgi:hypothetical protein
VTGRTRDPTEAALEPAAIDVTPKRLLDVARQAEAVRRPRSRLGEHGLEMLGDDAVERRGLGAPRPIAGG